MPLSVFCWFGGFVQSCGFNAEDRSVYGFHHGYSNEIKLHIYQTSIMRTTTYVTTRMLKSHPVRLFSRDGSSRLRLSTPTISGLV